MSKEYIPYTYFIIFTHPKTHKQEYYYGVQYGKNANPSNLWTTYFTSSKYIRYRRKIYGDSCFQYEVRKTFKDEKSAKLWEHKVLRRMKVLEKDEWLNKNDRYGPPIKKDNDHYLFGRHHSEETKEKIRKKAKERYEDEEFVNKIKESHRNRNNSVYRTTEFKEIRSKLLKQLYKDGIITPRNSKGEKNPMFGKNHSKKTIEEFSKMRKGKLKGEKNPMFGKNHSEETRKIISEKRKGRIWINNGLVAKSLFPDEAEQFLKNGWLSGRINLKNAQKYVTDLLS